MYVVLGNVPVYDWKEDYAYTQQIYLQVSAHRLNPAAPLELACVGTCTGIHRCAAPCMWVAHFTLVGLYVWCGVRVVWRVQSEVAHTGKITAIQFELNAGSDGWSGDPYTDDVVVYLGHTKTAVFTNNNDWVPFTQ